MLSMKIAFCCADALGARRFAFDAVLAVLLGLSAAPGATLPEGAVGVDRAKQPDLLLAARPADSSPIGAGFGPSVLCHAQLENAQRPEISKTNLVASATCCFKSLGSTNEPGHGGSRTAFSSGNYEPAASPIALFNFRSPLRGEHSRRFEFGLGRLHFFGRQVTSGQAPPPRPAQEWVVILPAPSTTPGLASKPGLRLFNWSF